MFEWIGLLVLLGSRLIQLNYSRKGRKDMQVSFLLLQVIGSFLLVINGFVTGQVLSGLLYLLVTGGALWISTKVKK